MSNEVSFHPFEIAGLGEAPFRFVGMATIPSPSLAETNPDAYRNALRSLPTGYHCGTCAYCGQAIMVNCLIKSSDGQKFAVGSDCVRKVASDANSKKNPDTLAIAREVLEAAAKVRREKAAAKREARRLAYLSAVCNENGETNAERIEREAKERQEAADARAAAAKAAAKSWEFVLPLLDAEPGNFCASVAASIRNGEAPRGRAVEIIREIYAKKEGRKGSKAYDSAVAAFNATLGSFIK